LASGYSDKYQLEKLFEEYYTAVLLYSISIVKDKADAEDIVQQAFISLWRKLDSIDVQTAARAYLYKTVYHASLDWLKHKKVRKRYEAEVKNNIRPTPTPNHDEKDLSKILDAAIGDLPDQCRRIFTMNRYQHLRYKDIAAALHLSEKTVENQMVKALKIIRDRLKDYYAR